MKKKILSLGIFFLLLGLFLTQINPVNALPPSKVYWVEQETKNIQRANLDGTNVEVIISNDTHGSVMKDDSLPSGNALDPINNKLYWVDNYWSTICRADLDGSNAETVISSGAGDTLDIALDPLNNRMYWTDIQGSIKRSDLNGNNIVDVISSVNPSYIAIDSTHIYWVDQGAEQVLQAEHDGSSPTIIVTGTLCHGIAADTSGYVYFSAGSTIQSLDLLGGTPTVIVTGLSSPRDLTVDTTNFKVYWADQGTKKIQRAYTWGGTVEDVVTGLTDPVAVVLDENPYVPEFSAPTIIVFLLLPLVVLPIILRKRKNRLRKTNVR